MKKSLIERKPAKIAPVASPKESHTPTSPRCAMQLIKIVEPDT